VFYECRRMQSVTECFPAQLPWPSAELHTLCAQELLEFVAHYHMLLDPINLVTCLYRLAKMSKEASRGRGGYLAELQRNPTFQLLLRKSQPQDRFALQSTSDVEQQLQLLLQMHCCPYSSYCSRSIAPGST